MVVEEGGEQNLPAAITAAMSTQEVPALTYRIGRRTIAVGPRSLWCYDRACTNILPGPLGGGWSITRSPPKFLSYPVQVARILTGPV
jgi:hypothetical protein